LDEIDYQVMPLFSTPLFIKQNIFIEEETKTFLKNQEFERMFSNNGDYGVDKYILNNPECASLKDKINDAMRKYAYTELRAKEHIEFYYLQYLKLFVKHHCQIFYHHLIHKNAYFYTIYYF